MKRCQLTNSVYFSLVTTVFPKSIEPYTTDCSCSLSRIPTYVQVNDKINHMNQVTSDDLRSAIAPKVRSHHGVVVKTLALYPNWIPCSSRLRLVCQDETLSHDLSTYDLGCWWDIKHKLTHSYQRLHYALQGTKIFSNIALVLQDKWFTIFTHPANTCTCPLKAYAIKNIRE